MQEITLLYNSRSSQGSALKSLLEPVQKGTCTLKDIATWSWNCFKRNHKNCKAFLQRWYQAIWHLISCFSRCYKNTEAFSSECFENSICTRLSCCIRSACNAFLGDMWFAVNDHEEPPHVNIHPMLLCTITGLLDGSSHLTSPPIQGLCPRKLPAAEPGILLDFTV